MKFFIGVLQVLLAGIGFGFLGVFGRLGYQNGLTTGELLSFRFSLAAILLWSGLILFRPKLVTLHPKQILISLCLGFLGYAVFSTLYFESMKGISIPLAAMLLFTFPIFVNLGAHFILKETLSRLQVTSLITASIGLVVLLWGDISVQSYNSVFLALGAALTYSIYVLVSGKAQQNVEPLSSSLYVITAAAIGLWFYHRPAPAKLLELNAHQALIILGIATASTIAPLTLFLAGLQKMKSSQASIIVMIEPVVATFAASYFLHEDLSQRQLVGAGIILVALVMDALGKKA